VKVALNADEIINGPIPGNHFQVISSVTELLRVIFFQLPSQKTWAVSYPITAEQSLGKGHSEVQVLEFLDTLCNL